MYLLIYSIRSLLVWESTTNIDINPWQYTDDVISKHLDHIAQSVPEDKRQSVSEVLLTAATDRIYDWCFTHLKVPATLTDPTGSGEEARIDKKDPTKLKEFINRKNKTLCDVILSRSTAKTYQASQEVTRQLDERTQTDHHDAEEHQDLIKREGVLENGIENWGNLATWWTSKSLLLPICCMTVYQDRQSKRTYIPRRAHLDYISVANRCFRYHLYSLKDTDLSESDKVNQINQVKPFAEALSQQESLLKSLSVYSHSDEADQKDTNATMRSSSFFHEPLLQAYVEPSSLASMPDRWMRG